MLAEEFTPHWEAPLPFPFDERAAWLRDNPGREEPETDWLHLQDQRELDELLSGWAQGAEGAADFIRRALWFPQPGQAEPGRLYLTAHQREALEALDDPEIDTVLLSWPKRHSKTVTNACVGLWRLCCHFHQGIGVLSVSRDHVVTTLYGHEYNLATRSPFITWLCGGTRNLHEKSGMACAYTGSVIRPLPCKRGAVSGHTYTLFQETEVAETADPSAGEMGASQTETAGAQTWRDSSAAGEGNAWTDAFRQGCQEPSTFVHYIHATPTKQPPLMAKGFDRLTSEVSCPWMRPGFVKSRRSKVLPVQFQHWHDNEFGGAEGKLFDPEHIARAQKSYLPEYPSLMELLRLAVEVGASGVVCCGGFDRSEPVTLTQDGDFTAWGVVARINIPPLERRKRDANGAPVHPELPTGANYVVCRMIRNRHVLIDDCERQIDRDHKELHLANVLLESALAGDIALHLAAKGVPVKLIHARGVHYQRAFIIYADLARQGRFHGSPAYKSLWQDMADFDIGEDDRGNLIYGASKHARRRNQRGRTVRDDTVKMIGYALLAFEGIDEGAYAQPSCDCLTDAELEEVYA